MNSKKWMLPTIVIAQFFCTSLWFAGNGIISDLIKNFNLNASALGHLTSAVQFGFITGTLLFALFTLTDRFSPSKVFFISAIIAGVFNLLMSFGNQNLGSLVVLRFLTGFFLAGIYPVGMKIASDYYKSGLGKSLGFLVGALVLGTALPHLLKGINHSYSWKFIVYLTSVLSVLGGLFIVLLVPDGPYKRKLKKFDASIFYKVFKTRNFRVAAFGYFGHMWELYAFWAFIPVLLLAYTKFHQNVNFDVSLLSFFIIGIGGVACVISGFLSEQFTSKKVATLALSLSCLCCLISPLFFIYGSQTIFITFLLFWGMVVIADSPLFSTLVAQNAEEQQKGTALTIVNCLGFAITTFSIQLLNFLQEIVEVKYLFLVLALGPILGLIYLYRAPKLN